MGMVLLIMEPLQNVLPLDCVVPKNWMFVLGRQGVWGQEVYVHPHGYSHLCVPELLISWHSEEQQDISTPLTGRQPGAIAWMFFP
jgi:hypothetical protein